MTDKQMTDNGHPNDLFTEIMNIARHPPGTGGPEHQLALGAMRGAVAQELASGAISQEAADQVQEKLGTMNIADLNIIRLDFGRPMSERILGYTPPLF
ncbi:hypothetical protein HLH33_17205 [Gluconacetobacter diazotrophicus]|uniref:Uncharacterized protein n=1 Tax=Gluconacetobacter diazotrophicus TaxID=33996 RepID=A0A7W4I864_GLUDI|nr:hypothetical protein [Gluconacetobacter diazotrophicus]MBB2158011.1 hypothetical protein [Gluconacetobacter diazotrophicus]